MAEKKRVVHKQMVRWIDHARKLDEKILAEYTKGGVTMTEIGKRFGVSRQRIHQRLARAKQRMGVT
jgi:DNA-directed RNA polymerase specialized sigma subunit